METPETQIRSQIRSQISGAARKPAALSPWLSNALLLLLCAALAALIANAISRSFFAEPQFDQSWFLYAAGRLLAGVPLYSRQLTEVNPPLIVWFSALPQALARLLHGPPLLMLKVVTLALMLLSAAWCVRILRAAKVAVSAPVMAFSLFAVLAAGISFDLINIGQREDLIVIFSLPYLFYAACYPHLRFGAGERLLMGLLAGIGVCFKPQEVLILVCVELLMLVRFRSLRRCLQPEVLGAIAGVCGYIFAVRFATAYFTTIPLLKDTFWAFAEYPALTLFKAKLVNHKFLLAIVLWLLTRKLLRYPAAPAVLLAASLGGAMAFAVQGTDWNGHLFPFTALTYMALAWIAIELFATAAAMVSSSLKALLVLLACLAVALPLDIRYEARRAAAQPQPDPYLLQIWARYPPQTPVYMFSTGLAEFTDVFKHGFVWSSRYAHLWMLPAIVDNERYLAGGPRPPKPLGAARTRQLAGQLRADSAEDLSTYQPAVVLVQHCAPVTPCQALGAADFDMIHWFLQSPAFAQQWGHYRLRSSSREFDEYVRVP
jgi:hypothetical protein